MAVGYAISAFRPFELEFLDFWGPNSGWAIKLSMRVAPHVANIIAVALKIDPVGVPKGPIETAASHMW